MKTKLITITAFLLAALVAGACTDVETIDRRTVTPEEQNPALYAAYLKALNAYKASEHYVTYARMDNAPEVSTSPGDFLKALPDSLDYVALTRPLSEFDREDLPLVRRKGTKVLAVADCSDAATATAALDSALALIAAEGLDGLVVECYGPVTDAAQGVRAALAAKLPALDGKRCLFAGNLLFLTAADRDLYELFILDATPIADVAALGREVEYLCDFAGFTPAKLLLSITPSAKIVDLVNVSQPAIAEVPKTVLAYKLGGLAVQDVPEDYYDPSVNYRLVRTAIAYLNPSK